MNQITHECRICHKTDLPCTFGICDACREYGFGLNKLRDDALRIATEHGFKDATVGEEIALMHSELSEALEEYRHGRMPNECYNNFDVNGGISQHPKPCGIPSEMADVIIRVLHFCGKHEIDIEKAVIEKMKYNESRPFMHGKKL